MPLKDVDQEFLDNLTTDQAIRILEELEAANAEGMDDVRTVLHLRMILADGFFPEVVATPQTVAEHIVFVCERLVITSGGLLRLFRDGGSQAVSGLVTFPKKES